MITNNIHYTQAAKLLTEEQKQEIVDMLAADPEMGDLITGTGGCRKLRYAAKAKAVVFVLFSCLYPKTAMCIYWMFIKKVRKTV
jgi:hypothetical protein